jgi:hypothetical protein
MNLQLGRLVALVLVCAMPAAGQTLSELLQKGVYTQETLGDVDGAIRIYQQIINTAPPGSTVRLQALRRLQAVEERLRAERRHPPLGKVVGNIYTHVATGLQLSLPRGWQVRGTGPSSDNGEMVTISAEDPNTSISVWLIPEQNDWESLNRKLDGSPAMKLANRQGWYPGYRLRDGSVQRTMVGPYQAMVTIGEYFKDGVPMAELLTWIYTEKTHTFFFASVPAQDLERFRPQFEELLASAVIP